MRVRAARLLLRRYQVELRRPLLIKQSAFGLVAAAPMLVAAGDGSMIFSFLPPREFLDRCLG
jgi:hypothetical protein